MQVFRKYNYQVTKVIIYGMFREQFNSDNKKRYVPKTASITVTVDNTKQGQQILEPTVEVEAWSRPPSIP